MTRFFGFSQFKRSSIPNGPKVGSGGSLSPRGDYRGPSDAEAAVWLEQLDLIPDAGLLPYNFLAPLGAPPEISLALPCLPDPRDIFPEWAVDAGILRKGLVYYFFRSKEKHQYRIADRIAVQSPANLDYFVREFHTRRYPLEVLYNWMNLRVENLPSTHYRAQLGLQGKVVFVYGGNLGVAQDVDNIVRLGETPRRPRTHSLLARGCGK